MAVAYVSNGTRQQTAGGTSLTPTLPGSRVNGYLLLAVRMSKDGSTHTCSDATWWKIGQYLASGSAQSVSLWLRVVNGSEVAPAIVSGNSPGSAIIFMLSRPDFDNASLSDIVGAISANTGSGTTHSTTGAVTTENGSRVFYVDCGNANTAIAAPSGWTEHYDNGNATGASRNAIGSKAVATAGTSAGNISIVGAAGAWNQIQLEIKDAVLPGDVYSVGSDADDVSRGLDSTWLPTGLLLQGSNNSGTGIGVRFTGITVPQGATITSAYLVLTTYNTTVTGTQWGSIYGDDVDNAAAWSSVSHPLAITQTTASVAVKSSNVDLNPLIHNVTAIVQELVDRAGWSSGNAMRFGGDPTVANGNMRFWDYSLDPANAARLYIEFDAGGGGTTYNDSLTESTASAESAATTAAWSSSRTETAASAAAQSSTLGMTASLSESAGAADALSAGLAYSSSLTETVGAAESSQTTASFAASINEAAATAEASTTTANFTASATESVAGSDARATSATWPTTRAESVAANDNAVAGSILSGSRSEIVSAQESATAANTITRSLSEQGTTAANQTAAGTFPSVLAETITADDDAIGNVVGGATTYDDVLSETVATSSAAAVSFVVAATRAETLAASVSQLATGIWAVARSETAASVDAAQAGSVIATWLAEVATSTAAQIVAGVFGYGLTETVAANDDETVSASVDEALSEAVVAGAVVEADGGAQIPVPSSRRVSGTIVDRQSMGSPVSRDASGTATVRHVTGTPDARSLTAVTVRRVAT